VSTNADRGWPDLAGDWSETRDTMHMWLQIMGKVRMALTPLTNQWWNVTLYVSARGLTTSLMPAGDRGIEIEFDFIEHVLELRTTDGQSRHLTLETQPVSEFYRSTMRALAELGVEVHVLARPSEIVDAIPFLDDDVHRSYDRDAVHRYWLALVQVDRVLSAFRSRFTGKASPVHLFWGGFDLCTTRFSGRTAPRHRGGVPNCPDWVQVLAYSHEVSSAGFWPGAGEQQAMFYAYAYPEPPGFGEYAVAPAGASYDKQLGEFLLPYADVRDAADPDATLLAFLQSTYEAAANLAGWDRNALEWDPSRPR
jgi:hypothetical protein